LELGDEMRGWLRLFHSTIYSQKSQKANLSFLVNGNPLCSSWLTWFVTIISTCACVEYYGRALEMLVKKVAVHCIHGKMKNKRNSIFADFRALKRWKSVCGWNALNLSALFTHHPLCHVAVGSWCVQMWWPEASTSRMWTGCCSMILPAVRGERASAAASVYYYSLSIYQK